MGSNNEAFFVSRSNGKRHKVKPKTRKFRGDIGEHRLQEDTYVNGTLFSAGWYPFVFWDVPIVDRHDNPITDTGVPVETSGGSFLNSLFGDNGSSSSHDSVPYNPDPTPSYTPDSSPSYDHSSSSNDGGSSFGGYDSGSSGGYDGGSSGGFDGGGGGSDGGGGF